MNAVQTSAGSPSGHPMTRAAKIRAVALAMRRPFHAREVLAGVVAQHPTQRFSMNLVCVVVNELVHGGRLECVGIRNDGKTRMRIYKVVLRIAKHGAE